MKTNPLTALELFRKEEVKLAIRELSAAEYTCWNDDLIHKYRDFIDWDLLSGNLSLRWSKELIMRYEDKWEWRALSYVIANVLEQIDFRHILFIFKDSISWSIICQGINITPLLVEDYPEHIDWQALSSNKLFNWSEDFVEKHKDQMDWEAFSEVLSADLFSKFSSDLMPGVNRKGSHSFSHAFIARYVNEWHWDRLSENTQLIFDKEFLQAFRKHWNWEHIVNNEAIAWSFDLLEEFNPELSTLPEETLKSSHFWQQMHKVAGDRFRNQDSQFMLALF